MHWTSAKMLLLADVDEFIVSQMLHSMFEVSSCDFLLQLGGIHQHHRRSVNTQIFHKLPGRLGFNLRNLVDESVLQEG